MGLPAVACVPFVAATTFAEAAMDLALPLVLNATAAVGLSCSSRRGHSDCLTFEAEADPLTPGSLIHAVEF